MKIDFTRKLRYVANGYITDTPVGLYYLCGVSRDSIIIALLVTALNDLDIWACEISNTYLNDP